MVEGEISVIPLVINFVPTATVRGSDALCFITQRVVGGDDASVERNGPSMAVAPGVNDSVEGELVLFIPGWAWSAAFVGFVAQTAGNVVCAVALVGAAVRRVTVYLVILRAFLPAAACIDVEAVDVVVVVRVLGVGVLAATHSEDVASFDGAHWAPPSLLCASQVVVTCSPRMGRVVMVCSPLADGTCRCIPFGGLSRWVQSPPLEVIADSAPVRGVRLAAHVSPRAAVDDALPHASKRVFAWVVITDSLSCAPCCLLLIIGTEGEDQLASTPRRGIGPRWTWCCLGHVLGILSSGTVTGGLGAEGMCRSRSPALG